MTGASKRILVVDDEARMCDSLDQLLSGNGYEVSTSQSGRDAIDRIKKEHFDLVLTDIKMPEFSGLDILRAGKEVDPELIVIMMTGYASLETALDAIKNGAFDTSSNRSNSPSWKSPSGAAWRSGNQASIIPGYWKT